MPRLNRVDPWGDLHAASGRGVLTGNRGCLVDHEGQMVVHHRSRAWISCVTEFDGRRHPLDAPRVWTPLFFLDEAVALAAGHRPCGRCRHEAFLAYQGAVTDATGADHPLLAPELDRRLGQERLRRGRGLSRRGDRVTWNVNVRDLPSGSVVVDPDGNAHLLMGPTVRRFGFDGWHSPVAAPTGTVEVLTPPISVEALRHGYHPVLHPSAGLHRKA